MTSDKLCWFTLLFRAMEFISLLVDSWQDVG